MAAILAPPRSRSASRKATASLELLRRWVAGDDGALQEWLSAGLAWGVDAAHRSEETSSSDQIVGRRGGARYKYPVEGR